MPAYFFAARTGSGRAAALGTTRERARLPAGSDDRQHARGHGHAGRGAAGWAGEWLAAYDWHNRYEEDGIEGLRDRPRPGPQPRVDAVTRARFKERMVAGAELKRDGVVAFRGVDAQRILKEEFEIDCSLSSTYRLLHRIKLSWLAPRPRHPEADATAQAEFSQRLDCN